MSISCAPTLESTSSLISIVPSWLALTGTRARWTFKKLLSLRQQQAPGCQRNFLGAYCHHFLDGSFCSQSDWICSKTARRLNTVFGGWENRATLLQFESVQKRLEMNCWLTASTSGKSTQLRHKWNDFCLFGTGSGVVDPEWRRNFSKRWKCFFFFIVTTRLSDNAWKEYSKRDSRLCTIYSRRNKMFYWLKGKNPFHFNMLDKTNLENSLVFCCHTHNSLFLFGWFKWEIKEPFFVG